MKKVTAMRTAILLLLLLPALALAQEFQFQQEFDTIPVEIDGWRPFAPWFGGFSESHPDFCDIDGDGDLDLFVGSLNYTPIPFFRNQGNPQIPEYIYDVIENDSMTAIDFGARMNCDFYDLDNDGNLDVLIGGGHVVLVYNSGTATVPNFSTNRDTLFDTDGDVVWGNHVALADIDADGSADLITGIYLGYLRYYRNVGTPDSFAFHLEEDHWLGINLGYSNDADPTLVDIDHDGDLDLFIGDEYGKIWYYRNEGTAQQYNFVYVTDNYNNIDAGDYASPEFADVDGDGDYDLLVGREQPGLTLSPGDI
jgi:hypothetical protein